MPRLSTLLLACLLTLTASCKLFGPDSEEESSNAFLIPSCGPTDGPALAIYLDTPPDTRCSNLPRPVGIDQPALESFTYVFLIGINGPEVGIFELNSAGNEHSVEGWAYRCKAGEVCAKSTEGTITLGTTDEEDHTSIRVDLLFEDGSRVTGHYSAKGCEHKFICG